MVEGKSTFFVQKIPKKDYVKLEHYFLDRTKIEANTPTFLFMKTRCGQASCQVAGQGKKELFTKIEEFEDKEDKQGSTDD